MYSASCNGVCIEARDPEVDNSFGGIGEGGAILVPPDLTNAIEAALSSFGAKITT